jgi:8-hydroxy-5-deazaflavin:NADPH oxidoreductase
MKIAVIGMGNVGSILGRRWAEAGHEVTFGVREKSDTKTQAEAKAMKASIGTVAEAAAKAQVVVLAVPWKAVPEALAAAGNLSGKVLVDCTNPLTQDLSGLEIGTTTSAAEEVAKKAKGAKVVKIFNTTGAPNMANPKYGAVSLPMLYAGDDADAKKVAAQLAKDVGFEPVDVGPLTAARLLEPMALIWITLAIRQKWGTDFAFNLIKRPGK